MRAGECERAREAKRAWALLVEEAGNLQGARLIMVAHTPANSCEALVAMEAETRTAARVRVGDLRVDLAHHLLEHFCERGSLMPRSHPAQMMVWMIRGAVSLGKQPR